MVPKNRDPHWWWTKFVVPIIGSGGIVTLLVAGFKACNHEPSPGQKNINAQNVGGNIIQSDGSFNYNEAPKPPQLDPSTEAKIRKELEAVERDIDVWENAKVNDELELMKIKNDLYIATQENRTYMMEACRQNIALQEGMMATKQKELEKSLRRRTELERQLLNR